MQTKLVNKLIILLVILIVVAALSFIWVRQQPVNLEANTEVCKIQV